MRLSHCRCIACITPPHLLKKLLESKDREIRQMALDTLLSTERLRGERAVRSLFGAPPTPADGRRTIFDCAGSFELGSASIVRTEQGEPSHDPSVNRAFDGLGQTRTFYKEIFERNSIDDKGMRLDGYVHRGRNYNNAFWDGQRMVFGDGDGRIFTDFTSSLDVIAHELSHGVTEATAGLEYHNQSGALNESMSDVFGSLVKQWANGETADAADWLIGAEVFTPDIDADALRSMKDPGSAYDNEFFGKDPQPGHMSKFVVLPDDDLNDNGGVHINSGIPNKAFYEVAIAIGGHAWEAPGRIWYESLRASGPRTDFQAFADTTCAKAGQLFGQGSVEQQAVVGGWGKVGIRVSPAVASVATLRRYPAPAIQAVAAAGDDVGGLAKKLDALAAQVTALGKEVGALKKHRGGLAIAASGR